MSSDFPALRARLYELALSAKRAEADEILFAVLEEEGSEAAMRELLEPVLRMIGERWSSDSISLAVAYVAGKIAEDLIDRVIAEAEAGGAAVPARGGAGSAPGGGAGAGRGAAWGRPGTGFPRIAVLGNAEDDYHGLGRRLVSAFLRVGGWKVVDLGYDVLPEAFVDAALREGARVVGVSAMMLTNAKNILRVRKEIDRRGLSSSLKLAVGGAVFVMRPELVAEVGGDGSADTAMEAPALFGQLAAATLAPAPEPSPSQSHPRSRSPGPATAPTNPAAPAPASVPPAAGRTVP
ncbi:MAG TPA: cobalamin-dependent protein [Spirochaetia bacterium]|nr:cobalamin-dependent protein [Spirochaetia bacterium]